MPSRHHSDSFPTSDSAPPACEDPRWELVERILATPDFKRAQKSSDFLRTICRLPLEGQQDVINEQYLGSAIFGRSADYDSGSDTIVRSHALRLRQRLEQYFQNEGKTEKLRLVIPRGAYIPQFVSVSVQPPETPREALPENANRLSWDAAEESPAGLPKSPPAQNASISLSRLRIYQVLLGLSAGIIAVLGVLLIMHSRRTTDVAKTRDHPLWGQIFSSTRETEIVPGDAGLALFHEVTHQPVSLLDYSNYSMIRVPSAEHMDPNFARLLLRKLYINYWDVNSIVSLTQLPSVRPTLLRVTDSCCIATRDFKYDNVILLGNQQTNPQVELFERSMDFVFTVGKSGHYDVIENRHPRPGESRLYDPEASWPSYEAYDSNENSIEYVVVAFLPGLGRSNHVLLIEGTSVMSTNAAVDALTHDDVLLPYLQKIRRTDGSIPHFEMLLACSGHGDSRCPNLVALHDHPVFP